MAIFFAKVLKNSDFSRHFQFYRNIVQNACEISLGKGIGLYNGLNKTNYFLTTQECWCQYFSKILLNKISMFEKAFYEIYYRYITAILWQRLVTL